MNLQDWRESWFRVAGLWRRRQKERELSEELDFHRAMKMSSGQSSGQANRDFGGFEKWKEVCRDVASFRPVEDLGRDLLLAFRLLKNAPIFAGVALVTLTLAIGANASIFSMINGLMLKSSGVPNANRLAVLRIQPDDEGYKFSYPLFQAIESHSSALVSAFTFSDRTFHVRGRNGLESVTGQLVSGRYFAALGLKPELGRWIEPYDDRPGAPEAMVAVVSHHFWQSELSGDRKALGRKIIVNQVVFMVVGVMPKGFRGMSQDRRPDVFVPFQLEPLVDSPFNLLSVGYRAWWFSVGGLLNNGVSLGQANAFLRTNSTRFLAAVAPGGDFRLGGHRLNEFHLIAEPGANGLSDLRLRYRKPLTVLMGLVAIVLLIACLNLATLMTARAVSRIREISTRFALGASRARLVRQLVTESLLLAVIGAGMGLAASPILAHVMAAMLTPQRRPESASVDVTPDITVFAFTAFIAILTTVLVGILPAIRSTRSELQAAMQEGSRTLRGTEHRHWAPRLLLAAQVGLSIVLVTGASLLGYSLVKLHRTPMGFDAQDLFCLFTENSKQPLTGPRLLSTYKQIVDEIRSLPGVQDASVSTGAPIAGGYIDGDIRRWAVRGFTFKRIR